MAVTVIFFPLISTVSPLIPITSELVICVVVLSTFKSPEILVAAFAAPVNFPVISRSPVILVLPLISIVPGVCVVVSLSFL